MATGEPSGLLLASPSSSSMKYRVDKNAHQLSVSLLCLLCCVAMSLSGENLAFLADVFACREIVSGPRDSAAFASLTFLPSA